MRELRAGEVTAAGLRELRCPERGCGRLLIRFEQSAGTSLVETYCERCEVWAEWTLRNAFRPVYKVVKRKV